MKGADFREVHMTADCFLITTGAGRMDGRKCVSISEQSGGRIVHSGIPDDLRDEMFRAQIHIVSDRLDTDQSLRGIAQLLGIEREKWRSFAPSKTCRNRIRSNILLHGIWG
jgi:hypothetical protein